MAGVKGRSGRKTRSYEARYEILEGLSVDKAIEIMRGTDEKQQFRVMLEVISKGLPQRLKVTGDGIADTNIIINIEQAKSGDNIQTARQAVSNIFGSN